MSPLALVTGGCGFIGAHLVRRLLAEGCRVRVLDNLSSGRAERLAGLGGEVELSIADVRDGEALRRAAEGADTIFHLAALLSVVESVAWPLRFYEVNTMGSLQVLEAAREAGVRRVVQVSTCAVYGNSERLPAREDELVEPLSPYATSKLAAEQAGQLYARLHGLETVALRVFNAYGPGQAASSPYAGVITHFIAALGAGRQPLIYGDGLQTRDFTFVGDVVEALWVAASAPAEAVAGQVFNVARGEATSLLALVAVLGELLGLEVRPQFEPARAGEARHSHADVDLLRERTGFQAATDLRAGLAATLAAFSTTPTH